VSISEPLLLGYPEATAATTVKSWPIESLLINTSLQKGDTTDHHRLKSRPVTSLINDVFDGVGYRCEYECYRCGNEKSAVQTARPHRGQSDRVLAEICSPSM
jgi:hypothetical protein